MSASKEFNNRRAQFMKLAAADDLPAILVKLAYLIAYKEIDLKTQTTRRRHATLAARMGVTPRTIQRLLAILTKRCGLVVQSGRGRRQMDTFWIGPAPAENATRMSHFQAPKCDMENATPMSHSSNKTPPEELRSSSGEGERERASSGSSSPSGGDPPADAGPRRQKQSEPAALPLEEPLSKTATLEQAEEKAGREEPELPSETPIAGEKEKIEEKIDAKIDAAWRELSAIYQRPWPETPREVSVTHHLFVKLTREGADPEAIITNARAWVGAFAEKPDMLKPLWKWLHGWEIPPPAKKKRQSASPAANGYRGKPQRMTRARASANYLVQLRAERAAREGDLSHG